MEHGYALISFRFYRLLVQGWAQKGYRGYRQDSDNSDPAIRYAGVMNKTAHPASCQKALHFVCCCPLPLFLAGWMMVI